jgi:FlaA1/EpsC-like NDP-sugar epimerase
MTDQENVIPTNHKKIMVLNTNCLDMHVLNGKLNRLKEAAENRDGQGIRNLMMEMIPEYRPN